jgi:hypothetical protein
MPDLNSLIVIICRVFFIMFCEKYHFLPVCIRQVKKNRKSRFFTRLLIEAAVGKSQTQQQIV